MNLRHIWGDATCGNLVSDTPTQRCELWCSCIPALQYMFRKPSRNDDELYGLYRRQGMFMFSNGQKIKNGSYFLSGGARASFGI
jgi:hypothetical protein